MCWPLLQHLVLGKQELLQQSRYYHTCQFSYLPLSIYKKGVPGAVVKNLPVNAGDLGNVSFVSGLGRSPGGGNGNPFQYSCLENSTDRGAWWTTVHGVTKESDMTELLSTHTCKKNLHVRDSKHSDPWAHLCNSPMCS